MEENRAPEIKRDPAAFTSAMTKGETALALLWMPVYIVLLPLLAEPLIAKGYMDDVWANFTCYALGALYVLAALWRYLRQDFDALWERPFYMISEVCGGYILMLLMNMALSVILSFVMPAGPGENPNNEAVLSLTKMAYGPMAAMTVFLAPIVEEPIFRGAIFGTARRYNRIAAYVISMLIFSLYHVWPYAIVDSASWIFILQYLPVSFLLCRCYERTNSIWGSIFLHMLINGVSLSALMELEKLL